MSRVVYGYPSVHGAVLESRKSYGPVRCGFKKLEILRRCGSVQLSDNTVDPTVRGGAVIGVYLRCGSVRFWKIKKSFGTVLKKKKSRGAVRCSSCDISYGAFRCGFQKPGILRCISVRFSGIVNAPVRFGAVIYCTVRFGAVPRWTVFVRCGSTPCRENAQHRFFSLVHGKKKPYKNLSFVRFSRILSRGTNETAVFLLLFFYDARNE